MTEEKVYSGYIVREYFGHNGEISQTRSNTRLFVKAHSIEVAELLIHELYAKDQTRWTPGRTSDKFPGDKVFIEDILDAEELNGVLERKFLKR